MHLRFASFWLSTLAILIWVPPAAAGGPPNCDGIIPFGTEEELAATPRADQNLELLALTLASGFTADPAIYDRVVADVGAARSAFPELVGISFRPRRHNGKDLLIFPDAETHEAISNGTYSGWDCLNDWYGVESVSLPLVVLELEGIYELPFLTDQYEQLPGLINVDVRGITDGDDICATRQGDAFHYYFRDASGDCPSGCIYEDVWYFVSESSGSPEFVDFWSSESGEPEPGWVPEYQACRFDFGTPPPTDVPALSPSAMLLLIFGLITAALVWMRRRSGTA